MVKYFQCLNCDAEIPNSGLQHHHDENHVEIPFEAKFFRFIFHLHKIKTIKCQICGDTIGNRPPKLEYTTIKHWKLFHSNEKLIDAFDFEKTIECIGIECQKCKKFMEQNYFKKNSSCPHGLMVKPHKNIQEIAKEKVQASKDDDDDDSIAFYTLRVSKSEMEKLFMSNRIYLKGGESYLKDS